MELALHTGAHFTEQERLLTSILRNTASLREKGVHIPLPDSYRRLVRGVLNAMSKAPAAPNARSLLLNKLTDGSEPNRVVLSDANFFRTAGTAIQRGVLYPAAAERLRSFESIFASDDIEVFVGVRNPATLVPLLHDCVHKPDIADFWADRDVTQIRWQDLIREIRIVVPRAKITVWCFEDLPLIWSKVIRAISGIEQDSAITGAFDLLRTLLSKEGMARLRKQTQMNPGISEDQKVDLISSLLAQHAIEEEMEVELEMPGWSHQFVEDLTDLYEDDVAIVAGMQGVTFLSP